MRVISLKVYCRAVKETFVELFKQKNDIRFGCLKVKSGWCCGELFEADNIAKKIIVI